MAALYLVLMVLVAGAILASTVSVVMQVSEKPKWAKPTEQPRMELVVTEDRRKQQLPFVGQDRRQAYRNQMNQQAQIRRVS